MKQKSGLRAIACIFMAAAMLFLTVPSFSHAELSDYDKEKLIAFWAQTDPNGEMCNGDRVYADLPPSENISLAFGPTSYEPGSWKTALVETTYVQIDDTHYRQAFTLGFYYFLKYYASYTTESGELIYVTGFADVFPDLYGPLDLSDTFINVLYTPSENQTHIESVMLDNCAALEKIYFRDQETCTALSAVNCPKLELISATNCNYKSIEVQPKGYDKALNIVAVCDGSVGADFTYADDGSTMTVYADGDENAFLGWYCNGDLISTEPEFNYNGTGKLTACFGGDADGDGVLSIKDSVVVSRMVLGLVETGDDISTLDADRNGSLAIADAVIFARIALGI